MRSSEILNWCRKNEIDLSQENIDIENTVISVYKTIRDVPFEVNLANQNLNQQLLHLIKRKKSSCSGKHYFLGLIYETLGIHVEYITCSFYWHELSVEYPAFIKKLAEKMPLTYHLAIRIHIDNSKFLLDATWDSPLEKVGFPINKMGDNLIDTKVAVKLIGESIVHKSALKREDYINKAFKKEQEISNSVTKFYTALNWWLEDIRKMKTE